MLPPVTPIVANLLKLPLIADLGYRLDWGTPIFLASDKTLFTFEVSKDLRFLFKLRFLVSKASDSTNESEELVQDELFTISSEFTIVEFLLLNFKPLFNGKVLF